MDWVPLDKLDNPVSQEASMVVQVLLATKDVAVATAEQVEMEDQAATVEPAGTAEQVM